MGTRRKVLGRTSPVVLALAGRPAPQEAIWTALRAMPGKAGTARQIADQAGVNVDTTRSYLRRLAAGGYVLTEPTEVSSRIGVAGKGMIQPAVSWRLVRDVGHRAPRVRRDGTTVVQGEPRRAAWQAMRIAKGPFTARDLHVQTGIDEVDGADYLRWLLAAGYLRLVQAGRPGHPASYTFVRARNTGPEAPQVGRLDVVFDPNLGKVVWPAQIAAGEVA